MLFLSLGVNFLKVPVMMHDSSTLGKDEGFQRRGRGLGGERNRMETGRERTRKEYP